MSEAKISETAVELPPLPKMQRFTALYGEVSAYSSEQMQEYARSVLAAAMPHLHPQPAELAEQQGVVAEALLWLRGALDCENYYWDPDQREAAEFAYKAALAATGKQQVGEMIEDDRFPGGFTDAIAYVNELEELSENLHQVVFGHRSDGEDGASTLLQLTLSELKEKATQVGDVQGDARRILAKHMRKIAATKNTPRLGTEADIVEGGEEYDFWMEAAHAAVVEALAARKLVGVDPRGQLRNVIQHAEVGSDSLSALIGLGVLTDPDVTRLAALLAHQPVGRKPVGYTRAEAWCDPMPTISVEEYLGLRKQGMGGSFRPYYFAPPAHGIDLGQQEDAARWRWVREQNGVTVSVEEADDDGDMTFVSGHTPEELDAAIDSQRDAAPGVGS